MLTKKQWVIGFLVLTLTILVIDYYTGQHGLGTIARALTWLSGQLWRIVLVTWERIAAYASIIFAGRVSRAAMVLTMSVGLGYFVDGSRAQRWYRVRDKIRRAGARLKELWQQLPLVGKLLITGALIALQVYEEFLLLLFPIGFMIPFVVFAWLRLKRAIVNYFFGSWYRKRFGAQHSKVVRSLAHHTRARYAIQPFRYTELLFKCGWRLWRDDPAYRRPDGTRQEIRGRWRILKHLFEGRWHHYLHNHRILGRRVAQRREVAE